MDYLGFQQYFKKVVSPQQYAQYSSVLTELFLIVVVMAGFILRVVYSLHKPFWLDEAFSFYFSQLPFTDLIFQHKAYWDASHPPGYYLLIKAWSLCGYSEFWLRLPSLLSYLGSVYFLRKVGLFFKSSLALLFVLLFFCFHPVLVQLGSELRMYSLTVFLLLANIYYVSQFLTSKSKTKNSPWLIVLLSILGFYIDYAFVWFIATLIVTNLVLQLLQHSKAVLMWRIISGIILGCLPQLYFLLTHFDRLQALNTHLKDILVIRGLEQFLSFSGLWNFAVLGLVLLITPFIILPYLSWQAFKTKDRHLPLYFMTFFGIFLPLVVVSGYSLFVYSLFNVKNLVQIIVLMIIGWGLIVSKFPNKFYGWTLTLLLSSILVFYFLQSYQVILGQVKVDWHEVRSRAEQGCQLIYVGEEKFEYEMSPYYEYYSRHPYHLRNSVAKVTSLEELSTSLTINNKECALIFVSSFLVKDSQENLIKQTNLCHNQSCYYFAL